MAYNEKLAERIREGLTSVVNVKEKQMMGGLTFMVKDKMCVGVFKDEMMCRIDPELREALLKKKGCRSMEFSGKPMKSYVLVDESGIKDNTAFDYWLNLCLDFNRRAKSSKKKK